MINVQQSLLGVFAFSSNPILKNSTTPHEGLWNFRDKFDQNINSVE